MAKRRTNANKEPVTKASPSTMMNATVRANGLNRSKAYFYGNMGDSIERRLPGDGFFGSYDGTMGAGSAWPATGYGNFFGTGLLNGYGRMHSGLQGGLSNGGFTYLRAFSSNSSFNHSLIASCELAYFGYGVVRNIVDLYADFATEGVEIDHPDKTVRNFYRSWATKVNLSDRIHCLFTNLFIAGTVFAHRRWAKLSPNEQRSMKKAEGSIMVGEKLTVIGKVKDTTIDPKEKTLIDYVVGKVGEVDLKTCKRVTAEAAPLAPNEENLPENKKDLIPWGYTFLNPLQMELRGSRLRGDSYWIMAVDRRDTLDIGKGYGIRSNYNQELGTTEINLPKEFTQRIKSYTGQGKGYFAEVTLSKEELAVIQAPGKFDWFDWAVPFVYPALKALAFKDCLRNMEMRACESVINSIFLFKLGNIEKGLPADDEAFERLADMLQMPGQALNILWNEAITGEVIQADVNGIFSIDKHQSADKDILTALGIPEVLIGGAGGTFSNSFMAVATVLERLESYRNKVLDWLMGELKVIADAMGFQKLPTIRFGRTSLVDEKAYQAFLTGLFDRNILSADTLLKEANTDAETEAAKLEEQKAMKKEGVFEPRGPFIKDPAAAPGTPGAAGPKTANGRPPGSATGPTGEQENKRSPVGQNAISELLKLQDTLQRRGRAALDQLEEFICGRALKAMAKDNPQLKHMKQLRAEDKERLEQLIYNIFSHMPPPSSDAPVQDEFILNLLRSDACEKIKMDVFNVYTDKISEYSKTYGKNPTREMRRQFMVSAWTQCAITQHVATKPDIVRVLYG